MKVKYCGNSVVIQCLHWNRYKAPPDAGTSRYFPPLATRTAACAFETAGTPISPALLSDFFLMAKDSLFFCFVLLSAATLAIPLPDAHPLRSSLHGWSHSTQPAPAPDAPVTAHEALLRSSESRTPITSDWVLSPPPPFSIMEHAMVPVACDSSISYPLGTTASIILIGGSNASGAASAFVISFDVGRRLWRALQPLPHPRQAAMAVFSQSWGGVVVCGGRCCCCICLLQQPPFANVLC